MVVKGEGTEGVFGLPGVDVDDWGTQRSLGEEESLLERVGRGGVGRNR